MISGGNSGLVLSRIIENGDFFVKIWGVMLIFGVKMRMGGLICDE